MAKNSVLPTGDYQPTYASGLLLDGFDFSEEYGEGVATARKDPTLPTNQSGLSVLPDGFLGSREASSEMPDALVETGDEAGFGDLSNSGLVSNPEPLLIDLSWLEQATQDPNRLPKVPNSSVLKGLVEAWGTDRRTTGIGESHPVRPPPPPRSRTSLLPGNDVLGELIASASRRSAFGEPLEDIVRDTAAALGPSLDQVHTVPVLQRFARDVRAVAEEHGVHGRVYLRDSAFPGLLTGKWSERIRQKCAKVPFWLTTPGSRLSAHKNFLGKRVVTEVPWRAALNHFRPLLEANGIKVASGDPKAALLGALSATTAKAPKVGGVAVVAPVDTVSFADAWKVFASAPVPEREVVQRDDTGLKEARAQVARWVSKGLLDRTAGTQLLRTDTDPKTLLDRGASLILAAGKTPTYMGSGMGVYAHTPETTKHSHWAKGEEAILSDREALRARNVVQAYVKSGSLTQKDADKLVASGLTGRALEATIAARIQDPTRDTVAPKVDRRDYTGKTYREAAKDVAPRMAADRARAEEERLGGDLVVKAHKVVEALVRTGSLGRGDADKLLASGLAPKEMVRVAMARVAETGGVTDVTPVVTQKTYSDTKYTAHVATPVKTTDDRPQLVTKVLRWASQQMSEGVAGKDLDHLMGAKFSRELLAASEPPLVQLRKKHEGLAGRLYVDASAYASVSGTTGCDKGALIHRANAVPTVLQMDRCGSCAFNVGGGCQKYGKPLVDSAPVEDPQGYQREALRLANGTDADKTMSYFAPAYEAGEYGLQNDSLDGFDLDTLPTHQGLGDILYEGMILPDEE